MLHLYQSTLEDGVMGPFMFKADYLRETGLIGIRNNGQNHPSRPLKSYFRT